MKRRERRFLATLTAVLAAAVTAALPAAGSRDRIAPQGALAPLADGWVSRGQPQRNYGAARTLRIGGSNAARAYLAFRTSAAAKPLGRATLRVYVTAGSPSGFQVVATGDRLWRERRLTYRNAPALARTGPLSGPVRTRRWATVDVTPLVRRAGFLSLAVVAVGGKEIGIASRESGKHRPRLVISPGPEQPALPVRAAFYYPWFPEAWKQRGVAPFTRYTPSLGFYDSGTTGVVRKHIEAMLYGRIQVGIASWWGRGTPTDTRLPRLLSVTNAIGTAFRWAVYYEREGQGAPSVEQIRSDLTYLRDRYGRDPSFFRLGGRFVVFAYGDPRDDCSTADRWKAANTVNAYVVLKVFPRYRECRSQPEAWHQYAPALAEDRQLPSSFAVSPGFNHRTESAARLERNLDRWIGNVRAMVASGARFQLITTFNEWGEGTSVESAREWQTPSGYGGYLDALHANGRSGPSPAPPPPPPPPPPPAPAGNDPVIAAAGDIACDPTSKHFNNGNGTATNCRQKATSDLLLRARPDAVLVLGDIQYENGEYSKFVTSFHPSWGRLKPIIRPAVGNHEYLTRDAAGYFQYFGAAAGEPGKGYYSYTLGKWHLIALNSECSRAGGCHAGSPQVAWLRNVLATHRNRCVLAYWHEPRFSSGQHGSHSHVATLWNELAAGGADVVLSGHNHVYERFEPAGVTPVRSDSPNLDPNGIRQFVVGTGGKNLTPFRSSPLPGEVVRNDSTYGVLRLTLHPGSYDWRFVPEAGKTFADSGSASCH